MIIENNITWLLYLKLIIALAIGYFALELLRRFLPQLFKRKSVSSKVQYVLKRSVEIYKPLVLVTALLGFVGINYLVHGIIVLTTIVLMFNYIKSYFNGVLFRLNPLVEVGTNISTGEFNGEISKYLLFGVIVSEVQGNRFIDYSFIDKHGFIINQNSNTTMRKILYLTDIDNTTNVIDLLFDNPIVDFSHKPKIRKIPNESTLELELTLESGGQIDTVVAYLNQYNIKARLTK